MFSAGRQIGPYTLARKLGRGGFGEVWLAERQSQFFTKKVAIKLPHDEQVDFETIRREAVLWEQASGHPNVLPIIDADVYQGQVVIVSEYAEGGSLADKLKAEGRLRLKESVEMTVGILNGLEFLHGKNIIHRDIKPANILLQGNTPRLADFGISRAMNTSTVSSVVVGTDAYMSPEAFDGKRNVQTDIWSVGVVLYQLLKGKLPFSQEHPSERMFAVLTKEFEPLPDEIPPDLKRIVQKALAKNPPERFQSAAEMREVLQRALVGIQYPTAAPTELLRHPPPPPPSAPVVQPPLSSPPTQNNAPPVQTNDRSIQTHVQTTPPEKETGQYARPTVETPPFSAPASMVTQISQPSTGEASKPLPTAAQAFADKKAHSKSRYKILYYVAGAGILGLILLLGIKLVFELVGSKKFVTNTNTKANPIVATNRRLIPFRKGYNFGFADESKNLVIEAKYRETQPFVDGLAIVCGAYPLPYKCGVIDKTGKEVVPLKYDEIAPFKEDLARVRLDGKFGFIDKTGKEVITPKYEYAGEYFSEGLVDVILDTKAPNVVAQYIDKSDNVVITIKKPKDHKPFSEGLAAVCTYEQSDWGTCGFVDRTGKTVIPFKYEYFRSFKEGLALVILERHGKYGFMDKTGKIVIQPKYQFTWDFSEGLLAAEITKDKWGFIDKTGKEVIPFKYESARNFSQGLACVKLNGKWGLIDKTGKEVIPFKYYSANPVEDLFLVGYKYNEEYKVASEMYIDKNGTEYYEP